MTRGRGDRDAFLDQLRQRLRNGIPENHVRPVTPNAAPPPVAYATTGEDDLDRFRLAATALGAHVGDVADPVEFVLSRCRDAKRVAVSSDPECAQLTERLTDVGIAVVPPGDAQAAAEADVGVTGAAYGLGLTGSLVVDSSRAGGRLASLLPPIHIALLRRDRILPDAGALLRHLGERLPDGLPSNLVFITGPSRSADIELQLTVGVHGPRELIIGLLEPDHAGR